MTLASPSTSNSFHAPSSSQPGVSGCTRHTPRSALLTLHPVLHHTLPPHPECPRPVRLHLTFRAHQTTNALKAWVQTLPVHHFPPNYLQQEGTAWLEGSPPKWIHNGLEYLWKPPPVLQEAIRARSPISHLRAAQTEDDPPSDVETKTCCY